MIVKLKHLLLEVTRRCDMACRHCMRGDAEDLSMDYAVIDRIFEDARHIGHLCLTGGEPSLAPQVIKEILYRARRWKCTIDSFFCATNAKTYSQQFVESLDELYNYCRNREHCTLTVTTGAFYQMLHNLQITPVNPESGAIPETLKLTIEPKERQKSMGNRLDEATVFYTDKSRKRRAVHIYVEHFPLEDTHHE